MTALPAAGRLGLLALAVCALVACNNDNADPAAAPVTSGPHVISAPPPPDALPGCAAIATALGDLATGFEVVDADGTRQDGTESWGISCAWRDAADGGAFGAIVIVDREPLTPIEQQRAGTYAEDARVSALGGFVAIPDGLLDGKAPLGPVGPQVIVGPVTVTIAGNGRGRAGTITLDQAVDAAVAVHRLMR